jgi:phage-related protein
LKGEVKTPPFSREARLEAGLLLRQIQEGVSPQMPHSRPMPVIGPNCHELRILDRDNTWRIVYHLDADAVVVLAVFAKKTQATPRTMVEACQRRLAAYRRAVEGD